VYDGSQLSWVLADDAALKHHYLHGPGSDFLLTDEVFLNGERDKTLWTLSDHLRWTPKTGRPDKMEFPVLGSLSGGPGDVEEATSF
jgi:hypothetical protein